MLGAIIGDMVGSVYEFHPIKTKEFNIFNRQSRMTDDSMLTFAVATTLLKNYPIDYSDKGLEKIKNDLVDQFIKTFNANPSCGYGGMFYQWATSKGKHEPYNSFGNGSAMRISPVGWIANSEDEVKKLSKAVSEITHNHPEGIKGAEAIAMCIFWARQGKTKDEIRELVVSNYYPEINDLDFETLVKTYEFSEICQKSCPQAIYCFLISNDVEDAIRNCVAIGGDCDTTGAMAGAIAEAFYSKESLSSFEEKFLYLMVDPEYEKIIRIFFKAIGNNKFSKK